MVGLSANIVATAMAVAGLPIARELFIVVSLLVGAVVFTVGLLSDLRGWLHPQGGVGLFFGTFNPFHQSHLQVIRRALDDRRLDKVIVHPTIVPRLHAVALARGEIHVARVENGMQVYERTEKADVNVDYFPTGRQFFAPEARRAMIELAIAEAGLADRVEVAYMPEVYARDGFHGVIRELKRHHRGRPLHGIHGSDMGAMYLRAIMDECGWIYPMPIARRDNVSATAIRNGATGMTSPSVAEVLVQLRGGAIEVSAGGRRFRNVRGALFPA
jgi:nicotinic acid mononucleotide adenylyltransferase